VEEAVGHGIFEQVRQELAPIEIVRTEKTVDVVPQEAAPVIEVRRQGLEEAERPPAIAASIAPRQWNGQEVESR
jgi:hypothetical protein